jgi:hypothetical protein
VVTSFMPANPLQSRSVKQLLPDGSFKRGTTGDHTHPIRRKDRPATLRVRRKRQARKTTNIRSPTLNNGNVRRTVYITTTIRLVYFGLCFWHFLLQLSQAARDTKPHIMTKAMVVTMNPYIIVILITIENKNIHHHICDKKYLFNKSSTAICTTYALSQVERTQIFVTFERNVFTIRNPRDEKLSIEIQNIKYVFTNILRKHKTCHYKLLQMKPYFIFCWNCIMKWNDLYIYIFNRSWIWHPVAAVHQHIYTHTVHVITQTLHIFNRVEKQKPVANFLQTPLLVHIISASITQTTVNE